MGAAKKMRKAQHTPGPWTAIGIEVHAPNRKVAQAAAQYGHLNGIDYDEAKVDAQLIAAAPELLDALEAVSKEWPYDADTETCECGEFCDSEAEAYVPLNGAKPTCRHIEALAAIAKARGES